MPLGDKSLDIELRLKEIRRESSSDAPGDPERFRRVALTNDEMMAQGKAIRETLAANAAPLAAIARDLKDRTIRRVAMVGCGDSWISGYGVRQAMEKALGAVCEPPRELGRLDRPRAARQAPMRASASP